MHDGLIAKPGVRVAKRSRVGITMRENFAVRKIEFRVIAQRNQLWMVEPVLSQRRSKGSVIFRANVIEFPGDQCVA